MKRLDPNRFGWAAPPRRSTMGQDYRGVADFGAIVIMGRRQERFAKVPGTVWVDPSPPPDRDYFTCQRSAQQP